MVNIGSHHTIVHREGVPRVDVSVRLMSRTDKDISIEQCMQSVQSQLKQGK